MRFLMSESHTVFQRCVGVLRFARKRPPTVGLQASGTMRNHLPMALENVIPHELCQSTAIADNQQIEPSAVFELWLALSFDRNL